MAFTTSQQISRYYDTFSEQDVTFTKDVIHAINLNPKDVFLKCAGSQWPCVIYSSSMQGSKVIVNVRDNLKSALRTSNNLVSLRYSFIQPDKSDPLSFLVSSKISAFTPYSRENSNLSFMNLEFTQRPPDGLIDILGSLLDANANSRNRKDVRIALTEETAALLGLRLRGVQLHIQGVPRKCILRDISFGGAKLVIIGVPKLLLNKEATVRLPFGDTGEVVEVEGSIIRFDGVEGRDDIAAIAIRFDEDRIPVRLKLRLNEYLKLQQSPKEKAATEARKQNEAVEAEREQHAQRLREARSRRGDRSGT